MLHILAGDPFYISPKELYTMSIKKLYYWYGLAEKRLTYNKNQQGLFVRM